MQPKAIRILLADDHTIVREGLRALIDSNQELEVVGVVSDGNAAIAECERLRPDVVIMDLAMPGMNGVDATRLIKERFPQIAILVLSMYVSSEHVRPALRAGANGYLLKGSGIHDLFTAIKSVHGGDAFFSPQVAKILLEERKGLYSDAKKGSDDGLTPREREVLKLVAEGKSTSEAAKILNLSAKTVEGHRGRIMAKLGLHNVAGMVRYAIKLGLVSAD